ncbi:MAG: hypothetical protein MI864_07690 [Pseudomonadales bacterium]|nr:hypothetical protein [Pseudomonadales bacterium]
MLRDGAVRLIEDLIKVRYNMNYEPIYESNERFTAFPDPDEVFSTDFEKAMLLPLGIYRPSIGNNNEILLAAPYGDEQGYISNRNRGQHCGETWLTYSKHDGKWRLDCSPDELASFDIYKEDAIDAYSSRKEGFKNDGFIRNPRFVEGSEVIGADGQPIREKITLFNLTTEYASSGENWFGGIEQYLPFKVLQDVDSHGFDLVMLLDESGFEYKYLGHVCAAKYAPKILFVDIHFFYSPFNRR